MTDSDYAINSDGDTGSGGFFAWIRELALIVVVAFVIFTLLRVFIVQVFWIPSASMRDTLVENDRIAVSRIAAHMGNIERGDVVVFDDQLDWLPSNLSTGDSFANAVGKFVGFLPGGSDKTLVKRVIGVGGDHVTCCTAEGKVAVNGVPVDEPYIADGQLPSDISFDITVPQGTLWVMGDNRGNSADSRYHMGSGETPYVPEDAVVGTVSAVIWPTSHWKVGLNRRDVFAGIPDAQ